MAAQGPSEVAEVWHSAAVIDAKPRLKHLLPRSAASTFAMGGVGEVGPRA
jgi:hypothetical protein